MSNFREKENLVKEQTPSLVITQEKLQYKANNFCKIIKIFHQEYFSSCWE